MVKATTVPTNGRLVEGQEALGDGYVNDEPQTVVLHLHIHGRPGRQGPALFPWKVFCKWLSTQKPIA